VCRRRVAGTLAAGDTPEKPLSHTHHAESETQQLNQNKRFIESLIRSTHTRERGSYSYITILRRLNKNYDWFLILFSAPHKFQI
jgi:hypothetical protein